MNVSSKCFVTGVQEHFNLPQTEPINYKYSKPAFPLNLTKFTPGKIVEETMDYLDSNSISDEK